MSQRRPGLLTLEELKAQIDRGDIDTVVVAITDMQGRLQGKRLAARYFLEEVVDHGTEGCNYLMAVDVDMNTVDGYAMSSWERGYGDFVMAPDFDTLRLMPWQPGSALMVADVKWEDGSDVLPSPRQILRRQLDRLAERGLRAFVGTELEFGTVLSWRGTRHIETLFQRTSTTLTTRCLVLLESSRCCVESVCRWRVQDCTSSR